MQMRPILSVPAQRGLIIIATSYEAVQILSVHISDLLGAEVRLWRKANKVRL